MIWIDVWRKQIKHALKQVPARKCQHASDECQHVSDRDAKVRIFHQKGLLKLSFQLQLCRKFGVVSSLEPQGSV